MGKHSSPAGPTRPTPFLLAPLLLVAAIVAALTIVDRAGQAQQSQLRTEPPVPAPAAPSTPASASAGPVQAAPTTMADTKSSTTATAGRVKVALLGAPDFAGYCAATGQGRARLATNDAYGWRCTSDDGTGDDAQAVCAWTYHTQKITNRVADFNNPDSWQCWRANRRLGSIDFAEYCRQTRNSGVYYVDGRYAYGWFCTDAAGGIDAQDACRRLYDTPTPVSRFTNFYDKNPWECWA